MNFKVIFHLDGTGVCYYPNDPIHLDALLAWTLAPIHCKKKDITRDDEPEYIPLPLLKQSIGDTWVWQASAVFPDGETGEGLQFWRKKFRQSRVDWIKGSPNLTQGIYREWNTPMPILLCNKMFAYASGNRKRTRKLLSKIKSIGNKRAYGFGKITAIECVENADNRSIIHDGRAMRWLPKANGARMVRPQPPYWNNTGKTPCCEVGEILK